MYIDITPIFIQLVHDIATVPYCDLVNMDLMQTFVNYVIYKHKFKMKLDTVQHFESVDELFYKSREYFHKNEMQEYEWVDLAIQKMQTYVIETNLVELFRPFVIK